MEVLWSELSRGFAAGDELLRVLIRLAAAILFGAVIGIERESAGKAAGVRTHMLVTLGTALFVIASTQSGFGSDALSRVIQGIVTGIGFIGAGTIIKLSEEIDVRGLTTSAGIWMAAAIGVTVGLGAVGLAAIATVFAVAILKLGVTIDNWISRGKPSLDDPTGD
ncbi:MAG: MgtC/SapB family protein [Pyrinomonadaceae bacterium]